MPWCMTGARSAACGRAHLSRDDRSRLVAFLDGRGAFGVRRAASHLADILGVSRATVYATLRSTRPGSMTG